MAREQRQANGLTVEKYNIIGTEVWIYQAWEPSPRGENGRPWSHSSLTRLGNEGEMVGKVGTRNLTAELEALPIYSEERFAAVNEWHTAQYEEAYAAIVAAFPEAAEGNRASGDIAIYPSR